MSAASIAAVLAALTCWACRPLVVPHWRYHTGNDDTERYTRLLGRQTRLTILTLMLTAIAVLAVLATPSDVDPDLNDLRRAAASCGMQESPYDPPTCYVLQPGGHWVVEEVTASGAHRVVATVAHPTFRAAPCTTKKTIGVVYL